MDLQSAVVDNRIVLLGRVESNESSGSKIWWEEDLVWHEATIPKPWTDVQLRSLAAGGPGIVAVGYDRTFSQQRPLIWNSADGKTWHAVDASAMGDGHLSRIGAASGGLVTWLIDAEESEIGQLWTSVDGINWTAPDQAFGSPEQMLLVSSGATLTVLVAMPSELTGEPAPYSVLRASAPDAWNAVGELPDSLGAYVSAAAVGPLGWVAVGNRDSENVAWTSSDGQTWQVAPTAPSAVTNIFADAVGFIGVGHYNTGTGCALSEEDNVGVTWTSNDGRDWRLVDEMEAEWINTLRRRNRTLIGIGSSLRNGGYFEGTTWTARLPNVPNTPGATPTPTPLPTPTSPGCGP